jgi:hypothetical protein
VGGGFSVAYNAAGDYTITFTEAFTVPPIVLLTAGATAGTLTAKHAAAPSTTDVDIVTFHTSTGVSTDCAFDFIAIGSI